MIGSIKFGVASAVLIASAAQQSLASTQGVAPPTAIVVQPRPMASVTQPLPGPPALVIGGQAQGTVLPKGTSVRLRTLTAISSQDNHAGDRFDLEVAEDVLLNGQVVVPRGSPAVGQITVVRKKGMWGKSGRLETRIVSVRAHGMDIPLRGAVGDRGKAGTAGVVASALFLPVAGFFVTGTTASLPPGSTAMAQTEADLPVVFPAAGTPPK